MYKQITNIGIQRLCQSNTQFSKYLFQLKRKESYQKILAKTKAEVKFQRNYASIVLTRAMTTELIRNLITQAP